MSLIDIGCGVRPRDGYVGIDRLTGGEAYPLRFSNGEPVPDSSVAVAVASHILEHFGHRDSMDVLREWVRVLAPGGVLKIAVPDFDWIARQYVKELDEPGTQGENVTGFLMGGQTDENDFHKAIFNEAGLRMGMRECGLIDIRRWESDAPDCSSLPVSLNLQGTKPGAVEQTANVHPSEPDAAPAPAVIDDDGDIASDEPIEGPGRIQFRPQDIGAMMSCPRLGFMDNMFSCYTLAASGIHMERSGGCFWDQGLTRLMQNALDAGRKYLLTLDYDSVFTAQDVIELYRIMESPGGERIDALAAMQIRREKEGVLLTMAGPDGLNRSVITRDELAQPILPIRTAHFGLTMIRADSLRQLPKPWLHSVPDADGEWGDKRRDSDVQFWCKWADAGLTVYAAPRVVIGHAEQVISWPDQELKTFRQPMSDYQENGKPPEAWK